MSLHEDVNKIYRNTLEKLKPSDVINRYIKLHEDFFGKFKRIFPVAFGKAAIPMMNGFPLLSNTYKKPIVVTNTKTSVKHENIDLYISSHPTPDDISVKAAKKITEYIEDSNEKDLVLFLISGGGSSILSLPPTNISLKDKIRLTELLLISGCDINELNIVRKHISDIKGGRLAQYAFPSKVLSLIISDVIDNDISSIASGPTVPDNSTFQDAEDIIKNYKLSDKVPGSIKKHIKSGISREIDDTPKIINNAENLILCSNGDFKHEIAAQALALGYKSIVIEENFIGEARSEAKNLLKKILEKNQNNALDQKIAIISGGETIVNIKGDGQGGRNQEFALSFLSEHKKICTNFDWILLSVGTDGIDGPTDAAGGLIDKTSIKNYIKSGLNIDDYLENNDSYTFLDKIDSLYKTGPTGTNVADIQIILIDNI